MLSSSFLVKERVDADPILSVAGLIEAFVSGASDGGALLRALYDDILDEAVPDRLAALCRVA
jgi:hypothetical protein